MKMMSDLVYWMKCQFTFLEWVVLVVGLAYILYCIVDYYGWVAQ